MPESFALGRVPGSVAGLLATSFFDETFEEVAADDAEPIHLPWDAARVGGVYWLDGDTVRSQPLTAKDVKARRKK